MDDGLSSNEEKQIVEDAFDELSSIDTNPEGDSEESQTLNSSDDEPDVEIDSDDTLDGALINSFTEHRDLIVSIEQAQELEMDAIKM